MATGETWEHEVAGYLRSRSYHADVRRTVGNHEIDVYATRGNETLVVECKDWETNVTKDPVRTVHNNATELGATPGLAYTSDLSSGAEQLADEYNVLLFPSDIIREEGPTLTDVREAVEEHAISLPSVLDLSELDNPLGPFAFGPQFAENVAEEAHQRSFEMSSHDKDRVVSQIQRLCSEHDTSQCVPVLRNDRARIDLYFIGDTEHHALPRIVRKESVSLT